MKIKKGQKAILIFWSLSYEAHLFILIYYLLWILRIIININENSLDPHFYVPPVSSFTRSCWIGAKFSMSNMYNSYFSLHGTVSWHLSAVWEPPPGTVRPLLAGSLPATPPLCQHQRTNGFTQPAYRHLEAPHSSSLHASLPPPVPLPKPDSIAYGRPKQSRSSTSVCTLTFAEDIKDFKSTNRQRTAASEKFLPQFLPCSGAGQARIGLGGCERRRRKKQPYDVDLVPSAWFGVRLKNCW